MKRPVATLLFLLCTGAAQAHRPSDAFVTLHAQGAALHGQWEVALRDVATLVQADADGDRAITWGELRAARPALEDILLRGLRIEGDGQPCALRIVDLLVNPRLDGPYAWLALEGACAAAPATLTVQYRLLFEIDPTHRGILALTTPDASHSAVFAPGRDTASLPLGNADALRQFLDYLREGAHHIWIGLDHILFLVALLLPSVLARQDGIWHGAERLRGVLWDVVRVVTAFTAAHSVTLSLAALGLVRLPAALVESVIALSVVLAALNNLYALVRARWVLAFAFGLMHGFGFASVLGELGLPPGARVIALLGFNLGVELGQLAIVAVAVPVAFALRDTAFYRQVVLRGGSLAVVGVAAVWFTSRSGLL
ncbi:MAG: HupE/UreJ family protein [Nevskiaceae bacterium]